MVTSSLEIELTSSTLTNCGGSLHCVSEPSSDVQILSEPPSQLDNNVLLCRGKLLQNMNPTLKWDKFKNVHLMKKQRTYEQKRKKKNNNHT